MAKIIGISGRKQSGKNTAANYINGIVLQELQMISDFFIDNNGSLAVNTTDQSGKSGYGILDVTRKDSVFVEYAQKELWPYIKVYHFADTLKDIAINLFGLNPQNIYGTDKQKNAKTHLSWEEMPTKEDKKGLMSHRDFLEYFGTKIVRHIHPDAWVKATINKIVAEDPQIAIIPDVRFPNEVTAILDNNGAVIRLKRDLFHDPISCESSLDENIFDWNKFTCIIDNCDISIEDFCKVLDEAKHLWKVN
ncbi:MAG: hypothetical protein EBU90_03680 [Proteobacteria bacterium]|nr:hypothetical protein [Pseudomonadota bacterium]NBP13674.1 hypothetical protein [bacterium]